MRIVWKYHRGFRNSSLNIQSATPYPHSKEGFKEQSFSRFVYVLLYRTNNKIFLFCIQSFHAKVFNWPNVVLHIWNYVFCCKLLHQRNCRPPHSIEKQQTHQHRLNKNNNKKSVWIQTNISFLINLVVGSEKFTTPKLRAKFEINILVKLFLYLIQLVISVDTQYIIWNPKQLVFELHSIVVIYQFERINLLFWQKHLPDIFCWCTNGFWKACSTAGQCMRIAQLMHKTKLDVLIPT